MSSLDPLVEKAIDDRLRSRGLLVPHHCPSPEHHSRRRRDHRPRPRPGGAAGQHARSAHRPGRAPTDPWWRPSSPRTPAWETPDDGGPHPRPRTSSTCRRRRTAGREPTSPSWRTRRPPCGSSPRATSTSSLVHVVDGAPVGAHAPVMKIDTGRAMLGIARAGDTALPGRPQRAVAPSSRCPSAPCGRAWTPPSLPPPPRALFEDCLASLGRTTLASPPPRGCARLRHGDETDLPGGMSFMCTREFGWARVLSGSVALGAEPAPPSGMAGPSLLPVPPSVTATCRHVRPRPHPVHRGGPRR